MTDEPYPPPPPPSSPPRTSATGGSQRAPRALIAGVIVLAVLAAILLILVLTRDPDGAASGSASPTPSSSPSASATGSASASAGQSATPVSSPSSEAPEAPDLAMDSVVATTVDRLTIRAAPGLSGERLGTLESGALSFVAGGPTDADGFSWYVVSGLGLPPNTGCAGTLETDPFNCPIWFGWAAAASEGGVPWLVEHDLACPEEPLTAESLALGRTALERLACFGSEPITFRGYWPEIPDGSEPDAACNVEDAPTGWLLCQQLNANIVVIDEAEAFDGLGVRVSIDPESDATMPERGTWVEVRVHLDDPAAQDCDDDAVGAIAEGRTPEQIVLGCRSEMVLESSQAVDGP